MNFATLNTNTIKAIIQTMGAVNFVFDRSSIAESGDADIIASGENVQASLLGHLEQFGVQGGRVTFPSIERLGTSRQIAFLRAYSFDLSRLVDLKDLVAITQQTLIPRLMIPSSVRLERIVPVSREQAAYCFATMQYDLDRDGTYDDLAARLLGRFDDTVFWANIWPNR